MRMKRLFQIVDTRTGKSIEELFFHDKMLAKAHRRQLNDNIETGLLRYIVSPGPDHHKYNARSK